MNATLPRASSVPAGSPAKAVRHQQKLSTTRHTSGRHWNAEVIKALCRRIPGGDTSVTTECDECGSMFYPCICRSAGKRENYIPHQQALRAPRIVWLSENFRIKSRDRFKAEEGNLALVRLTGHRHGLDRYRCEITPFDDPERIEKDEDMQRDVVYKGKVKYRVGDTYAIEPDDEEPWQQEIELTKEEWSVLKDCLDEDMYVQKDSSVECEWNKVSCKYSIQEDADGDLEIAWRSSGFYVQSVTDGGIAKNAGVDNGYQLIELRGLEINIRHNESWQKLDLNDLPLEFKQRGKLTASPSQSRIARRWQPLKLNFRRVTHGWCVVQIVGVSLSSPKLHSDDIDAYFEDPDVQRSRAGSVQVKVRLKLQRKPVRMVSRTAQCLRHEYHRKTNTKNTPEQDTQLLIDWGINSKLTPSQLQFTFKKLQENVQKELDTFHEYQDAYERSLSQKYRRAVELDMDLKDLKSHTLQEGDKVVAKDPRNRSKAKNPWLKGTVKRIDRDGMHCTIEFAHGEEDPQDGVTQDEVLYDESHQYQTSTDSFHEYLNAHSVRFKAPKHFKDAASSRAQELKRDLDSVLSDIEVLLFDTPRSFLTDMCEACGPRMAESDDDCSSPGSSPKSHRHKNLKRSRESYDFTELTQMQEIKDSPEKYRRSLRKNILKCIHQRNLVALGTHSRIRARSRAGGKRVSEDDLLRFMHEHLKDYTQRLRDNQVQAPRPKPPGAPQFDTTDTVVAWDGRMSFDEFHKAMYLAGICWLAKEELEQMFNDMDADRSGRLHLGEILDVASRMQEISRQARAYEKTEVEPGRKLTQSELLEEFCTQRLIGDDLTTMEYDDGPFLSASDPEKLLSDQDLKQCHVDSQNACYEPKPGPFDADAPDDKAEEKPWLKFHFREHCVVTAVAVKGDPKNSAWVRRYRLKYCNGSEDMLETDRKQIWHDYRNQSHHDVLDSDEGGHIEILNPTIAIHPTNRHDPVTGITGLCLIVEDYKKLRHDKDKRARFRLALYGYRVNDHGERVGSSVYYKPKRQNPSSPSLQRSYSTASMARSDGPLSPQHSP